MSVPAHAWRTAKQLLALKRIGCVHSVRPDHTVIQALRTMCDANTGAVLVMEPAGSRQKLVGILSERDYARKVILVGRASSTSKVADIMTKDVITAKPSLDATECMNIVLQKRIRHLPIVDENGDVQGVLSIGDLLREVVENQANVIAQMTAFIEGHR
eukprot:TRINITY_DN22598_c0_g1_i1.p2 TRINITY_DN22598_c0_g1~~TRINITY_DN22598_c0_g1_i1.p2  ORF type:complete len:158 (+),score=9.67 TRINITY_DN22598_c0_g1_i1:146-619(+)